MNKKLIALALAGAFAAPLAAQAQSTSGNVTIYGFLRIAAEGVSMGGSTAALPATQSSGTRLRVVDNSSALGFRGEEDLGGGLKAIFQLESAVLPDGLHNGATPQANGFMARNTHVGLKGNWGEFTMGRWDMYYHDQVFADINILKSSLAASGLALIGNFNGAYVGGTRVPNTINYTTPTMNGFSAKIQYSTGASTEVKTSNADERNWALRLWYLSGPAHVGYSYIRRTDLGNVNGADVKGNKLYGRYTFGDTTVGLIWEKLENRASSAVSFAKRNVAVLTVNHQMGANHLHFTYGGAGSVSGLANTGAKYWTLGYGYDFSKRTTGHITYAKLKNQSAGNYDFFAGGAVCGAGLAPCGATGADPAVFQVGVTHSF